MVTFLPNSYRCIVCYDKIISLKYFHRECGNEVHFPLCKDNCYFVYLLSDELTKEVEEKSFVFFTELTAYQLLEIRRE